MKHQWDDGEWEIDVIVSTCEVCGGVRVRDRVEGIDYINGNNFHLDGVGRTRRGWRYVDTPRSCPGRPRWEVSDE